MDEEIAEKIRKHGWFALSVPDAAPPFLYSIGLVQKLDHPELIIFGLESRQAHGVFTLLIEAIRNGASFNEPGVFKGIVAADYPIGIRRVHPTQHQVYLGYAMGYCRHTGGELKAVQVFWPDARNKFPFDVGCDLNVYQAQPRLDQPLTRSEIAEFEREWR